MQNPPIIDALPISDDSEQGPGGEKAKNQEDANKNDTTGEEIPKWPYGQEEAQKDTDQQKEAVEEYVAPKGNTFGSE